MFQGNRCWLLMISLSINELKWFTSFNVWLMHVNNSEMSPSRTSGLCPSAFVWFSSPLQSSKPPYFTQKGIYYGKAGAPKAIGRMAERLEAEFPEGTSEQTSLRSCCGGHGQEAADPTQGPRPHGLCNDLRSGSHHHTVSSQTCHLGCDPSW